MKSVASALLALLEKSEGSSVQFSLHTDRDVLIVRYLDHDRWQSLLISRRLLERAHVTDFVLVDTLQHMSRSVTT